MQWDLSDVLGYRVHARDGSLGTVTNLYVDDVYWKVRYLVVTGEEQPGERLFPLATEMVSRIDREIGWMSVLVSTDTVRNSPAVATGRTIPWRQELRLREYYGLPYYWFGLAASRRVPLAQAVDSPHLHSLTELLGYRVLAADGAAEIGRLLALSCDDRTWSVHSLEVEASRWWPAGRVWLRSDDIQQVCGSQRQLASGRPLAAVLDRPKDEQAMRPAADFGLALCAASWHGPGCTCGVWRPDPPAEQQGP